MYFVISKFKKYFEKSEKKIKVKMKLYMFGIALYLKCHFLNLQAKYF